MKYNLVYKLLSVETNVKDKFIPYFSLAPWFDNIISGTSKYRVGFYVKPDVAKPSSLKQRLDCFWGNSNSTLIYYEHPLFFGAKAKMLLDMSNEFYSITVNRWYYRLVYFKFENVFPSGLHLTNLVFLKLLQNKILIVHCASFSNKVTNEGYLVFGASNTGKSYTTFSALKTGAYQYHSEDLTVLDAKYIYTTPLISAHSQKLPNPNLALKYNLFIRKVPVISWVVPLFNTHLTFRKFISNYSVKSKARISKIFILENGKDSVRKLDSAEALRKIRILNKLEFSYRKDDMLLSYSYFNKKLDMENVIQQESKIIEQIADGSECFLVKADSPAKYLDYINKILKSTK